MIRCTFENGNQASLRHVVVDTLMLRGQHILLTKRAAHLSNGGKYGLIGGYMDRDETAVQAAQREVREETGYAVHSVHLFRIIDSPHRAQEDRQNVAFVFVAEAMEKVGEPDSETQALQWFELTQLPAREEFAFDHYDNIELYLRHLKQPFPLPIFEH